MITRSQLLDVKHLTFGYIWPCFTEGVSNNRSRSNQYIYTASQVGVFFFFCVLSFYYCLSTPYYYCPICCQLGRTHCAFTYISKEYWNCIWEIFCWPICRQRNRTGLNVGQNAFFQNKDICEYNTSAETVAETVKNVMIYTNRDIEIERLGYIRGREREREVCVFVYI